MRKIIFLLAVMFLFGFYNTGNSTVIDDTIAVVNNEPITVVDLFKTMQFYQIKSPDTALSKAIEDKLVIQRAKKLHLSIDKNEYQQLKNRFITKKRLELLNHAGLKRGDLEKFLKLQMLKRKIISYVVRDNLMVTDEQIKKQYLENKERFKTSGAIHLYEIAFNYDKADETDQQFKASKWLVDIKNGKISFISAAKKLGFNNFDMGWIESKQIYPSFYNIVKKLKIGEVYGLVRTKSQFLIIKLVGRRKPHLIPLAKVKDRIRATLINRNIAAAFTRWIDTLKQYASIHIYEK